MVNWENEREGSTKTGLIEDKNTPAVSFKYTLSSEHPSELHIHGCTLVFGQQKVGLKMLFFLLLKTPDGQQIDADLLMKRPVCLPDCFSSVPTSLVSHVKDVQVWLGKLAKGHLMPTIMDT